MYELQNTFSAGPISPKAWLRHDIKGLHDAAVKRMTNVISDSRGPASSRLGFDFIVELENESYCRIFDFNFSSKAGKLSGSK